MSTEETIVHIPGSMKARVQHGRILGFDFMPSASYAGYFGPEINISEGPEITAEDFWDMVSSKLVVPSDMQSSSFIASWVS